MMQASRSRLFLATFARTWTFDVWRKQQPFMCLALLIVLHFPCAFSVNGEETIRGFVEANCLDCHSGEDSEGSFDLDSLALDVSSATQFQLWAMVHHRVVKGEMPPQDAEKPDPLEKASFLAELSRWLADAERQRQTQFGRRELRRLSRAEYANSLQDLLDLPYLELEEMLPPDGLAHGYTKSADALDFSHVMVSRYLEAADHALWQALAKRVTRQARQVVRAELKSVDGVTGTLQTLRVQLKQTIAMPLVGKQLDPTLERTMGNFQKRDPGYVRDPKPYFDGVATFMNSRANHNIVLKPFKVKQTGFYQLRVHGWGLLNDHGKLLPSDRTETVAFYSPSGRLLGRCDLPPNEPTTSEVTVWLNEGEPIEFLAISTPNENIQLGEKFVPKYEKFKSYGIGLQWFEMEGPLTEAWPPASHRRLLGDLKLEPCERQPNGLEYRVVTDEPVKDARRLLGRFAARAFRRPPRDTDIQVAMRMVRPRLERGEPFVDALMAGYRAILSSPEFLLLDEDTGRLNAWALASRLSYFLWNSPPDAELRASAESARLLKDVELRRQTDRLLNDPKSERFIQHFLDYWLDLREISLTEPDENLYPEYNALLAESMVEETRAFFSTMIREDLGADHVVDSDFLTINQRLAELYEEGRSGDPYAPSPCLPLSHSSPFVDVQGSHIRKVSLPSNSVRGGLVTQASLLKLTANGTTTSPVVRGTYALTKLLGDPPPPPPASVSAIEPDISGATTIREQLAKHRSVAECAACHQKIDPPGFALESFDVMGAWRTHYRASLAGNEKGVDLKFNGKPAQYKIGLPVDSAGQLPDGNQFVDINEFRELLVKMEPQIARHLLEQFIVYATGTPAGFADESIVDAMLESLARKSYGVRSMIHEVVQSDLFRKK